MKKKKLKPVPSSLFLHKTFYSFLNKIAPKYIFIILFFFLCIPVFLKAISYVPIFVPYFEKVGEYGSNYYLPQNSHTFFSQVDSRGYYAYLPSFILHGDFDFSDDYAFFGQGPGAFGISQTTSREGNYWSIGPAILWSPFFLTGHFISSIAHKFNDSISLDGYNLIYELLCYTGTIFYVVFGLYLTFLNLKDNYGDKLSLISIVAVFFASPLIFYTVFEPSMSHGLSFFTLTLVFFGFSKLLNDLDDKKASLIFSIGIALSIVVRWQNIFILPLAYLILLLFNRNKTKILPILLKYFSISFLFTFILFIPQSMAWKYVYGSYFTMPQGSGFLRPFHPEIIGLFFSNIHGMFLWNPIYIACFAGLVFLRKQIKTELFWLFLTFLLSQIYINSIVSDWGGGEAFGMRRMVDLSYIYFFGFAAFMDVLAKKSLNSRPVKIILYMSIGFLIYFNLVFIYQWKFVLINRVGLDLNFDNYFWAKFTLIPRLIEHFNQAFIWF